MQTQKGLKKDHEHKKFVIGAHPIIQHFIEILKIPEIISTYVSDDKRRKIETESILCLLIHNCLVSTTPLYELSDWLQPLDTERLGITPRECKYIYDERVARGLESFYASRYKDIFFRLALRAIKLFELDCHQIHQDTTTITLTGKYNNWDANEQLTYGHNKDYRPDLKQLVLGISVTADGAVPISHEIYSGNQTDDRLHPANHKKLQKLLNATDFIYVADSKLATAENLKKISQWSGYFVSVMPRTWAEDAVFRKHLINNKTTWKHILSRANNRLPKSKIDHYYLAEKQHTTSQGYILHWIKSTQKAEQDGQTRERRLKKASTSLRKIQTKLNKYSLKSVENIQQRVNEILKDNQCQSMISVLIGTQEKVEIHYETMGRPTSGTPKNEVRKNFHTLSFKQNNKIIEEQAKTDGVFPLITNLDPSEYDAKSVLEIYKFQPFLEKRHSQLKTYQEIAPIYLKKDERVLGLLHIQVMALMIASLIERTIRKAMKVKKIQSIPIYPEDRPCKSPTLFDIVRLFRNVERYEVNLKGKIAIFPAQLNKVQKLVLSLLGIPVRLYQ